VLSARKSDIDFGGEEAMTESVCGITHTPPYRERRLADGVDYQCIDVSKISKRDLAPILMDEAENRLAVTRVAANQAAAQNFAATYVIGLAGTGVCKIGFSANPLKRMTQLQTALWADVVCHALFWAPTNIAGTIELRALNLAKKEKLRLRGEWVSLSPEEAVGLCLTAMDGTEAFADSRTFTEKWLAPLEGLYRKDTVFSAELLKRQMDAAVFQDDASCPTKRVAM
jgi:hypothetical protein